MSSIVKYIPSTTTFQKLNTPDTKNPQKAGGFRLKVSINTTESAVTRQETTAKYNVTLKIISTYNKDSSKSEKINLEGFHLYCVLKPNYAQTREGYTYIHIKPDYDKNKKPYYAVGKNYQCKGTYTVKNLTNSTESSIVTISAGALWYKDSTDRDNIKIINAKDAAYGTATLPVYKPTVKLKLINGKNLKSISVSPKPIEVKEIQKGKIDTEVTYHVGENIKIAVKAADNNYLTYYKIKKGSSTTNKDIPNYYTSKSISYTVDSAAELTFNASHNPKLRIQSFINDKSTTTPTFNLKLLTSNTDTSHYHTGLHSYLEQWHPNTKFVVSNVTYNKETLKFLNADKKIQEKINIVKPGAEILVGINKNKYPESPYGLYFSTNQTVSYNLNGGKYLDGNNELQNSIQPENTFYNAVNIPLVDKSKLVKASDIINTFQVKFNYPKFLSDTILEDAATFTCENYEKKYKCTGFRYLDTDYGDGYLFKYMPSTEETDSTDNSTIVNQNTESTTDNNAEIATMPAKNITIDAIWEDSINPFYITPPKIGEERINLEDCIITFDANGGQFNSGTSDEIDVVEKRIFRYDDITGWNLSNGGTDGEDAVLSLGEEINLFDYISPENITGDIICTPIIQPHNYDVNSDNIQHYPSIEIPIPENLGYKFIGYTGEITYLNGSTATIDFGENDRIYIPETPRDSDNIYPKSIALEAKWERVFNTYITANNGEIMQVKAEIYHDGSWQEVEKLIYTKNKWKN